MYLYKKGCIHKVPMLNAHHVQRDLESLHPGQSGLLLQGDYYIRKLQLLLLVLCAGTLLGVMAHAKADREGSLTGAGELLRPLPGQGEKGETAGLAGWGKAGGTYSHGAGTRDDPAGGTGAVRGILGGMENAGARR